MSYISGNAGNFASRLHQLATNQTALDLFITESLGYTPSQDSHVADKWDKEARLAKFRFSRNAQDLISRLIGSDSISEFYNLKTNTSYGSGLIFDYNQPFYANGKLYFKNHSGMFYIMDVSGGVDNLTIIGSVNMASLSPVNFVVNGNVVYFLGSNSDIGVVNIAIPSTPIHVTTITSSDHAQGLWSGAFIYENYLYVSGVYGGGGGNGKVFIYNINNPLLPVQAGVFTNDGSDPQWVGNGNWGGGNFGNVCIKGNYLYVPNYYSVGILGQGLGEFYVVNISNKSNPVLTNAINIPQGNDVMGNFEPWTFLVKGNYLYINDDRNIAYYDLTNPALPVYKGMVASLDGDTESAIIIGDSIFWACNSSSIMAWDISQGCPTQASARLDIGGGGSNGLAFDSLNKIVYFMKEGKLSQASYSTNPSLVAGRLIANFGQDKPWTINVADTSSWNINNGGHTYVSTLACPLLATFDCSDNFLVSLNIQTNAALTNLDCSKNTLSAGALDEVLGALVRNGKTNGTVDLRANAEQPSAVGLAHKTTLEVRGWTVLTFIFSGRMIADVNGAAPWDINMPDAAEFVADDGGYTFISLTDCVLLTSLVAGSNSFSSVNLSTNTALTSVNLADNSLASLDLSYNNFITYLNLSNNLLTESAVDDILLKFVIDGANDGTCNLGGSGNVSPSAAGLVNKAILQGRGWTVTNN